MKPEIHEVTGVSPTAGTEEIIANLRAAAESGADYLLLCLEGYDIELPEASRRRMVQVAADTEAKLLYCDYRVRNSDGSFTPHPLAGYQWGSVRDDFDFGPAILLATSLVGGEATDFGDAKESVAPSEHSGLYALRLFIASRDVESIVHLREPLYTASEADRRTSGEKQFDYVDARNASVQKERERVFTSYLKDICACLPPAETLIDPAEGDFPVEASVIIPVRDRAATVGDAVASALSQKAGFDFNVIVVDNHSTDGTTELLASMAAADSRIRHIIPESDSLGIGGCWNLAVNDPACGRFAVQLDSDDKYKDDAVLERIVELFRKKRCAMAIGSYELTDFDGNPIPPGLIDHKEWTDSNGHNNALRINGLGAPRAFFTPVLREIGVPNVSYGEDYALGLRISRNYRIGRIYESLYLCRRWKGNSDANLSQEKVNANNTYKDLLRTIEISARTKKVEKEIEKYSLRAMEAMEGLQEFVDGQLGQWPLARKNTEALAEVEEKEVVVGDSRFKVVFNPAREVSSAAKVDAGAIAARPCFLCPENRPDCQNHIDIIPGFKLLLNPFPVFDPHFTIVSDRHEPQLLESGNGDWRGDAMFDLCGRLPGMTVFYNGARCGASAPDHLHFQAVSNHDFPLFANESYMDFPYLNYHFTAYSREELKERMKEIIAEMARFPENRGEAEPRFNLFMTAAPSRYGYESLVHPAVEVVVVPRRAHRPDFYGSGEGEMLFSPGALDVGGTFITVRRQDFDRLDPLTLESVLRQTVYWND